MKIDMQNATAQQAVEYAVEKIVDQGGRCMSKDRWCAYGNKHGQHCAIGWLLDHEDKQLMESDMSVDVLAERWPQKTPQVILDNLHIFDILQNFHDCPDVIDRQSAAEILQNLGINMDFPAAEQWIEMGED